MKMTLCTDEDKAQRMQSSQGQMASTGQKQDLNPSSPVLESRHNHYAMPPLRRRGCFSTCPTLTCLMQTL